MAITLRSDVARGAHHPRARRRHRADRRPRAPTRRSSRSLADRARSLGLDSGRLHGGLDPGATPAAGSSSPRTPGRSATHDGVRQGFHGEASLAIWDVLAQDASSCELETHLLTAPLHLRRVVTLAGDTLTVTDTVTNLSPDPVWTRLVQHPAFGAPFLDEDSYLVPGAGTIVTDADAPGSMAGTDVVGTPARGPARRTGGAAASASPAPDRVHRSSARSPTSPMPGCSSPARAAVSASGCAGTGTCCRTPGSGSRRTPDRGGPGSGACMPSRSSRPTCCPATMRRSAATDAAAPAPRSRRASRSP